MSTETQSVGRASGAEGVSVVECQRGMFLGCWLCGGRVENALEDMRRNDEADVSSVAVIGMVVFLVDSGHVSLRLKVVCLLDVWSESWRCRCGNWLMLRPAL